MLTANTDLYERAAIIPGCSLTRSKAPGRLFPIKSNGPLYCSHGAGAVLYDVQHRAYIDMICGLGAISLGYDERLKALPASGVYSLPHSFEVTAAEMVLKHVAPWASSVRFVKTGSEATHAAYRIAAEATGRSWVLVGDWAYHGWHEWCSPAPYRIRHNDSLNGWQAPAAVFIEPHRWEPVNIDWLQHVRRFCDQVGALLVFDEMIYGGRWALGGATEYFGVQPDLACFGKAFGNGQAVAFVVGNDALRDHGEIVSGTYSGDVTGLSAVCDTLNTYVRDDVVAILWARGRQLERGLTSVLNQYSALQARREGMPVHQRVRFRDPADGQRFAAEMARRGILWHPDVVNVCAAHTRDQIEHVIEAADASCRALMT